MAPYDQQKRALPAAARGGSVRPARIGDILLRDGSVDADQLARSLALQARSRARIGEILVATGATGRETVAAAAAEQLGLAFADLAADPPDERLWKTTSLEECLETRRIPWRSTQSGVVYASAEYASAEANGRGPRCRDVPLRTNTPQVALAEQRAIQNQLVGAFGPALARRAAKRRPDETSHRIGATAWQRLLFVGLIVAAVGGALMAPVSAAIWFLTCAAGIIGLNGAMWAMAFLMRSLPARKERRIDASRLADFRRLPTVSILVPLYCEPETAPLILHSLAQLDYPAELLDIKLILEADDEETLAAFQALNRPAYVDILIAPQGSPQTKPRALNFALEFAKGEIIGIYDAEDRPAPDQVRKIVAQFADAPPDVACIQARLGYYNSTENWLTRCFEIEYASWFDVMLPGLSRLGLPLPLGGTSLFIRRGALDVVSGWDSYNVTEDADLGMTLARAGLRTILSSSLTEEEANSRVGSWIRQRSRWLKGYLATWVTHMRNPLRLWQDLGTVGFLGFNVVLLSAVAGYLLLPALWAVSLGVMISGAPAHDSMAEGLWMVRTTGYLTLATLVVVAAAGLAHRGRKRLWPFIATLPLYWVLGAIAVYLAVWELIVAPVRWHKTQHGVGVIAQQIRRDALEAHRTQKCDVPGCGALPGTSRRAICDRSVRTDWTCCGTSPFRAGKIVEGTRLVVAVRTINLHASCGLKRQPSRAPLIIRG
ncbi:MAG: glycosyltransferase family 2 protein [Pseudomonadota bacterium]